MRKMNRITVIPEATDYHITETDRGTEIIISDAAGEKTEIILKGFHLPKKQRDDFHIEGGMYDELGY